MRVLDLQELQAVSGGRNPSKANPQKNKNEKQGNRAAKAPKGSPASASQSTLASLR